MVFSKNKRAQAAIEFLMTYGWMLLVVLIVGALIFSFVDFGSLLPNKVDLSNNLRASATESVASAKSSTVTVVFGYNGAKAASINISQAKLDADLGGSCPAVTLRNIDLKTNVTDTSGIDSLTFLNGHDGVIAFNCSALQPPMIVDDVIEGKIVIPVTNAKTGISVPSKGTLRLQITD